MQASRTSAHLAAESILAQYPQFKPKVGIVLGSGLGQLAESLQDQVVIPYHDLPGFPHGSIQGHAQKLVLGRMEHVDVVCLQGRAHLYEGEQAHDTVKTYIRTLKLLGCEYLIATNAVGSLHESLRPGELVLIHDHINLQPTNPLVGPNDDQFGPRFLPLDKAYDPSMQDQFQRLAREHDIPLHRGIYLAIIGPNYETAAEIRAFRTLGADVVGMSTVPEVLVAAHCGLKIGVISIVTNYATGLNPIAHNHADVVSVAEQAGEKLAQIIRLFLRDLI